MAVKRFRFNDIYRPLMGDFRTGIGASYALTQNSQVSFFANAVLNISDDFKQSIALAGGGRTQFITTITDYWKLGGCPRIESLLDNSSCIVLPTCIHALVRKI